VHLAHIILLCFCQVGDETKRRDIALDVLLLIVVPCTERERERERER
jgi:hypothetical protein